MKPSIGRIVWYRTDGRNGLAYDLPAIITVTQDTHPGDYSDGRANPLIVPSSPTHVHLTVFSPGGFGTMVTPADSTEQATMPSSADFPGGRRLQPGSGTYVELDVPMADEDPGPQSNARTWRWPTINKES